MRFQKDYLDFIKLLNKNKVQYCIVGAYAMAFHAKPRYTKDMDIFIKANMKNSRRILMALNEFGFKCLNLTEDDFIKKDTVVQLGYEPVRIDVLTSIDGCTFKQVWENKQVGFYGREKTFFIGLNELIRNKKASNRKQDLADIEILTYVRNKKKNSHYRGR